MIASKNGLLVLEVSKLYLVTRKDLDPGAQAAQLLHAMREFIEEHPEIDKHWYKSSNTVVLLSVSNLEKLQNLLTKAKKRGINCSAFFEPDLNDELTAIVLEPTESSKNLCKELRLALTNLCSCGRNENTVDSNPTAM